MANKRAEETEPEDEEIFVNNLTENYPNPFNPSTTIKYSISNVSSDFSLRNVSLKVYDILGREVTTLVNKYQKPGNYTIIFNSSLVTNGSLPSGVYFYKITIGDYTDIKKMILMK